MPTGQAQTGDDVAVTRHSRSPLLHVTCERLGPFPTHPVPHVYEHELAVIFFALSRKGARQTAMLSSRSCPAPFAAIGAFRREYTATSTASATRRRRHTSLAQVTDLSEWPPANNRSLYIVQVVHVPQTSPCPFLLAGTEPSNSLVLLDTPSQKILNVYHRTGRASNIALKNTMLSIPALYALFVASGHALPSIHVHCVHRCVMSGTDLPCPFQQIVVLGPRK